MRLDDGALVLVRPLVAADREALAEAYRTLSGEARRRRFLRSVDDVDATADALTRIEGADTGALVAVTDDGRIIGEAAYALLPDDPEAAEVAVSVRDGFHRQGIGSMLLRAVAGALHDMGLIRLVGHVQLDNRAVLALIDRLGGSRRFDGPGVYRVELDIASVLPSTRRAVPMAGPLPSLARGALDLSLAPLRIAGSLGVAILGRASRLRREISAALAR